MNELKYRSEEITQTKWQKEKEKKTTEHLRVLGKYEIV